MERIKIKRGASERSGSRATALSEEGRNQQESHQRKELGVENKKKWLKKLDSVKQKKERENDDLQWRSKK